MDESCISKFYDELKAYGIEVTHSCGALSQRIVDWARLHPVEGSGEPDWDALVDDFLAFALPEKICLLTEEVWLKFKLSENAAADEQFKEVDDRMKALPSDLRDYDDSPRRMPVTPKSHVGYHDEDDGLDDLAASYGAKVTKKVLSSTDTAKTRPRGTPSLQLTGNSPAFVVGSKASPSSNKYSSTPSSSKLASRVDSGSVLLTAGNVDLAAPMICANDALPLVIKRADHHFKFMQQRPVTIAVILSDHIDGVAERLLTELVSQEELDNSFEGLANVRMPSQSTIWVAGMIFCDHNSGQVYLQGSESTSGGANVELDLSTSLNDSFSIFDGCCVVARGSNYSGRMFVVDKLLCLDTSGVNNLVPKEPPSLLSTTLESEPCLELGVACGPFTTTSDLNFDLLMELIKAISEKPPNFLVLIGPLLDCDHPLLDSMSANVNCFTDDLLVRATQLLNQSSGGVTQLIYVASARDVGSLGVFPTPPAALTTILAQGADLPRQLHCASDPAELEIGDGGLIKAAVMSVDILAHMGGTLVESAPPPPGDRIGRIIRHLITQRSLYPLYPPKESVFIDYEEFEQHCFLETLPHIMFLPSNLRYFVKEIDGMLCVNPGKLAKGQTGGTYCRLTINCDAVSRSSNARSLTGNYRAQIVKI